MLSVHSVNRISGSLPSLLLKGVTSSLILNNLGISGSLPAVDNQELQILSLTRNHLVGNTHGLTQLTSLTTLLLSGNHISCNAAQMNDAYSLGTGSFLNPVPATLMGLGEQLVQDLPVQNPFLGLGDPTTRNTVVAFAGNPELTAGDSPC